ncbi:MAG: thermonuclease family protein [Bacillota bacterium]
MKRPTVELRPSRIRRDPLLSGNADPKKVEVMSREREMWLGVFGVALFGVVIATLTVSFSVITGHDDAAAASVSLTRFGACEGGPNCVVDGDTIRIAGSTVRIAGMEAPDVQSPHCDAEAERGAQAIDKLTTLLNSGKVTTGGNVSVGDGVVRTRVLVDGKDVGAAMVDAGVARKPGSDLDWCSDS